MHAIFKEKLRLPIPNELTIECFLFICTIVFGFVVPVSGELYYLCFAYPFWFALLNLMKAKSLKNKQDAF